VRLQSGSPSVHQFRAKEHSTHFGLRGCLLAKATWPRCGVQDRALELLRTQAALGFADGLALSVSVGVAIPDDATGTFSNEAPGGHQDSAVRLIAPAHCETPHRLGGVVPAAIRMNARDRLSTRYG